MNWLFLFLAIITEVFGTMALKGAEGFSKLVPSLIAVGSYAISFYFLSLTMKTIPVGVSYAIWSGVGIVLISLLALWLYQQSLDTPALVGMGMICGGVLVINLFSKSVGH